MKNLFILLMLLLSACIKTDNKLEKVEIPKGGLLPDDPAKVALVPLLTSKDFLKTKRSQEIYRGKPTRDRIPPTVNITSPVTGTTVTNLVQINVTATDNIGVKQVIFTINGQQYFIDIVYPYYFVWDATNLSNGIYNITVTAKDDANNSASQTIYLTKNVIVVDPPTEEPSITYEMKTPPIGNQGSEGSCAAWSIGYAARSIDWYYKNTQSSFDYAVNIFSPEFLYNQIKFSSDCNSGTAMQTALDFIKLNGIPTWSVMPYESGNCATLPTVEQSLAAQPYKLDGYYKVYTTDTAMIKSLVRQNKAVIISINLDNLFLNAKTGFIWKNTGSGFGIGHSVVIIGYNEELKAWKIMNSFGTGWGTGGFAYMEYDMFPTRTGTYCYAIN